MPPTRRWFLGAATATFGIGLAGCAGDGDGMETTDGSGGDGGTDGGSDGGGGTDDGSGDDGGTNDGSDGDGGPTVQVRSHEEYGDVLVGPDGLALYNFDSDEQGGGESTCYDGCAESWPPLTVESADDLAAGDGVTADLSTIERTDGSIQVVANGWPLYYFASDEEPGDAEGQGLNDVWWVVDPEGEPQRAGDESGLGDEGDGDGGGTGGEDGSETGGGAY